MGNFLGSPIKKAATTKGHSAKMGKMGRLFKTQGKTETLSTFHMSARRDITYCLSSNDIC